MNSMSDEIKEDKEDPTPWLAEHRFKKGQSGNPGGRPKGRSIEAQLRKLLNEGEQGEKIAESIVKVGIQQALRGDFRFWNAIIERVDGKVADRIAGADGGGLTVILESMRRDDHDDSS